MRYYTSVELVILQQQQQIRPTLQFKASHHAIINDAQKAKGRCAAHPTGNILIAKFSNRAASVRLYNTTLALL